MDLRNGTGRKELGRRIQAAIAGAGYQSLAVFAEALGCSRALIYQYVNGDVLAQLDRLCEIAELTDRPLDWFLVTDPNGCAGEVQQLSERLEQARERCERLESALADERGARLEGANAARQALLEALQELCRAQRAAGDAHGLVQSAARCGDLARSLGDAPGLMAARLHAGHAAWHLGRREAAEEALTEALAQAEELGDRRSELSARQELVRVWQASGRVEQAREQAQALADSERWWPRWAGTVALAALSEQVGDLDEAAERLSEAEAIIADAGAPAEHVRMARVFVQSNRANIALARGHYAEAATDSERLHDLAAEVGLPDQVREATLDRALAAMRGGQIADAGMLIARLREWGQMAGDARLEALAAGFEAERLMRMGRPDEGRQAALAAMELGNEVFNGQTIAEAELAAGMACLVGGMASDAAWHLHRARERAQRLGLRRAEAAAQVGEARARLALGEEGAEDALREARDAAHAAGFEDLWIEAALADADGAAGELRAQAELRASEIGYLPLPVARSAGSDSSEETPE